MRILLAFTMTLGGWTTQVVERNLIISGETAAISDYPFTGMSAPSVKVTIFSVDYVGREWRAGSTCVLWNSDK